jgi:dTDP-4-amino-4,6-dideoxygalactose transaminase
VVSPLVKERFKQGPIMAIIRIPFNKPTIVGKEMQYMQDAIARGHISGNGHYTFLCNSLLEEITGAQKVFLTTSCTHALEMTAFLLKLREGDEVIVPSFTFASTANAFAVRGARLVFSDIRPDTMNLDESHLERLISPKTKAIVSVHYAGVGCEMDAIMALAAKHHVHVIEDNAHGLLGRYRGRNLGTFGTFTALSFHETKNFTCGEGGAILVNNEEYVEHAEIIRDKGTNRSQYFRGQIDKYSWVGLGSSYLPSDMLAAFLLAQLEAREDIQRKRKEMWRYYRDGLKDWARKHGVQLPFVPTHCDQTYHMFYLVMPSLETRQSLITQLREKGIMAVFHYVPLHLSGMGRCFGGKQGDCPITEAISARLLRLPFYHGLTRTDQNEVIDGIICSK